jgi:glycosyltransferase involved in cell wall biosynthesis
MALPGLAGTPIGGYKVIYEHANRLSRRGHVVTVVHPHEYSPRPGPVSRARSWAWAQWTRRTRRPPVGWFALDSGVRVAIVPRLLARALPPGDALVVAGWQTAEALARTPAELGRRVYLAMDYEHWRVGDRATRSRIEATLRGDWRILALSPAVTEMLAEQGVRPVAEGGCGIDFDAFGTDTPIAERDPRGVGFANRPLDPPKATRDAVTALDRVRAQRAGLRAYAYGPRDAGDLPGWVDYDPVPDDRGLRAFYNRIAIFVMSSHFEGLGLPGLEALACGAALVTTDCVGNREYARDGETALVVPPGRPELLADAVARLLDDDALRRSLAARGHAFARRYRWDEAVSRLEAVLAAD